jgi:hypothetical protein
MPNEYILRSLQLKISYLCTGNEELAGVQTPREAAITPSNRLIMVLHSN